MNFEYEANRSDGTKVTGVRSATDRFALARDLRAQGLTPLSAREVRPVTKHHFSLGSILGGIKIKDKIVFASSLSAMIGAGLSLGRALNVIERQIANKRFKKVINEVEAKITTGESLSQALRAFPEVFPPVFVAMVAAGEESGNLPQSLEVVRQQLAKSYDLQRKVRGALIYPIIIFLLMAVIAILMMIFVVPTITGVFKDFKVALPLSTRIIIATSDFVAGHTIIFLGSLFALLFLIIRGMRTLTGQRAAAFTWLRFPIIKTIVKNLNAAVTMRTISSLLLSGVSLIEAINITVKVIQNPYYQEILHGGLSVVEKGQPLSSVFQAHEDLYPVLVGEMTEVGEETGNLSGMLLKGAIFFEEEVDQATKNLSVVIEPALMILIGIAVGFFAISIIGPIYSLSSTI